MMIEKACHAELRPGGPSREWIKLGGELERTVFAAHECLNVKPDFAFPVALRYGAGELSLVWLDERLAHFGEFCVHDPFRGVDESFAF